MLGDLQRHSAVGPVTQSGPGREGGIEGFKEHLYTQYLGIAHPFAG